jgi:3-oxoacyl-[acyl-carrier-protein] synthase II
VAARQALKYAELDPAALDPSRLGVCFGTSFGAMEPTQKFMDSWMDQGTAAASPLQFMNSVHGVMASQIALDINAKGVNLTVAQRDVCFEGALDTAVQLLGLGRADVLLVGAGDELTPMLHEFASRTGQVVLEDVPGLDPWGSRRGVVPGDGAAVFVLERDDSPRRPLARIAGVRTGRHDHGGDLARRTWQATGEPGIGLVTNNRDGGARCGKLNDAQDALLGTFTDAPVVSHRGNFGTSPSAGALQFAANVLMLSNGEFYEPLANGRPSGRKAAGPRTILHNAPSISGSHAAYMLTRAT